MSKPNAMNSESVEISNLTVSNQVDFIQLIQSIEAARYDITCTDGIFSLPEKQIFKKIIGQGLTTKINLIGSEGESFKISQLGGESAQTLRFICTGEVVTHCQISSEKKIELVFSDEKTFNAWQHNVYDERIDIVILDDELDALIPKPYDETLTREEVIVEFVDGLESIVNEALGDIEAVINEVVDDL